jgi:hypothetical protein
MKRAFGKFVCIPIKKPFPAFILSGFLAAVGFVVPLTRSWSVRWINITLPRSRHDSNFGAARVFEVGSARWLFEDLIELSRVSKPEPLTLRKRYSGDFLGVTDFSVWPVGNNRKIDCALFWVLNKKIINDNIDYLQELNHFYIRKVTPASDPIVWKNEIHEFTDATFSRDA